MLQIAGLKPENKDQGSSTSAPTAPPSSQNHPPPPAPPPLPPFAAPMPMYPPYFSPQTTYYFPPPLPPPVPPLQFPGQPDVAPYSFPGPYPMLPPPVMPPMVPMAAPLAPPPPPPAPLPPKAAFEKIKHFDAKSKTASDSITSSGCYGYDVGYASDQNQMKGYTTDDDSTVAASWRPVASNHSHQSKSAILKNTKLNLSAQCFEPRSHLLTNKEVKKDDEKEDDEVKEIACEICHVLVNSSSQLQSHLAGKILSSLRRIIFL